MEHQRNTPAAAPATDRQRRRQRSAVDGAAEVREGREPFWPATFMVIGIILFVVAFWTVVATVYMPIADILRWFAFLAFAGNLVPYRFSGARLGMARFQWFMFNLLAIGPLLFTAVFALDHALHGPVRIELLDRGMDPVLYWRENGERPHAIPWEQASRQVPQAEWSFLLEAGAITGTARGALGHEVRTLVQLRDLGAPPSVAEGD